MEPKIIFLGTGGESLVTAKQMRACGGIIIHAEDYQFQLDPGPGALVQAAQYNINVRNNTAILVSHAHLRHCNDVNALISAMTYSGLDKKGILVCNKTLYEGSGDIKPYLLDFYRDCLERTIILNEGQRVGIENIEIRGIRAEHTDPNTLGFKFFTPAFTLTYSSDTQYSREVVNAYEKSDILILNTLTPFGVKSHLFNSDDVVKIIERVKPRLTIIQHFGMKMIKADPMNEAREISKKTGTQVIAAKDGMEVNPVSYSANLRQRTLLNY